MRIVCPIADIRHWLVDSVLGSEILRKLTKLPLDLYKQKVLSQENRSLT